MGYVIVISWLVIGWLTVFLTSRKMTEGQYIDEFNECIFWLGLLFLLMWPLAWVVIIFVYTVEDVMNQNWIKFCGRCLKRLLYLHPVYFTMKRKESQITRKVVTDIT